MIYESLMTMGGEVREVKGEVERERERERDREIERERNKLCTVHSYTEVWSPQLQLFLYLL